LAPKQNELFAGQGEYQTKGFMVFWDKSFVGLASISGGQKNLTPLKIF
jgi:hypothetical protein